MSDRTERHPAAPSSGLAGEGRERMPDKQSMSDRTERHPAAPSSGLAGEGRERMPDKQSMSDRTERHPAAPSSGLAGEGRERMPDKHGMSERVERPLALFAAAATVEIVAVAADWTAVQWVAKPLLAPLLIWHVLRHRRADLVVVALAFATAGDIALLVPGEAAFLTGMLFFLCTQICLIAAFVRGSRPLWWAFAGYGLLWAGANAVLWSRLGALRVPVLLYSLALTAMAAAAAGVSRRVAAGGALFLVSDLLIGLGAAGMRPPAHGVLVMTTYAAALFLIATGWAQRQVTAEAGPSVTPSADSPRTSRWQRPGRRA